MVLTAKRETHILRTPKIGTFSVLSPSIRLFLFDFEFIFDLDVSLLQIIHDRAPQQ
jgi:hypothetical protein